MIKAYSPVAEDKKSKFKFGNVFMNDSPRMEFGHVKPK